jgi:hypothetical protein
MLSANFLSFLIIFSFISVTGSIGNLLTAMVYWRKKDKQTSTFFILVLAISDLVVCSLLVYLYRHQLKENKLVAITFKMKS